MAKDDLVERLRKEDEWTNQRPYFHAHAKSLEAADHIEAQAAEIERLRNVIRQAIVDGDVKASPLPPTGVFQTPEEYWYRQGKDDQYETNADRITTLEAENAKLRADNAALVEEATVVCPKNDDRLRTAPEAGQ